MCCPNKHTVHFLHSNVKCFSRILRDLGVEIIYELFRERIKHTKVDRKLTNADIAKLAGYRPKTIEAFMGGGHATDRVAEAISKALNIEI